MLLGASPRSTPMQEANNSTDGILKSESHPYLGELLIPRDPETFLMAYTRHIVNKSPVRGVVNPYNQNFQEEWVNYDRLARIVCGEGWSISRPFEGSKRDDTITVISYIGLDFDDTD